MMLIISLKLFVTLPKLFKAIKEVEFSVRGQLLGRRSPCHVVLRCDNKVLMECIGVGQCFTKSDDYQDRGFAIVKSGRLAGIYAAYTLRCLSK